MKYLTESTIPTSKEDWQESKLEEHWKYILNENKAVSATVYNIFNSE